MAKDQRRAAARKAGNGPRLSESQRLGIQLAFDYDRAGKAGEAEKIYRQILADDPRNAIALHLLGVLAYRTGRVEEGLDLTARAVRAAPAYAPAWNDRANMLRETGRLQDALAAFRRAARIAPDVAEIPYNAGNALKAMQRPEEAVAQYRKAIGLNPRLAGAYTNLGNTLRELGRNDEALAAFRRVLEIDPHSLSAAHMIAAITGETTPAAPDDYVRKLFDDYAATFDRHLVDRLEYRVPVLMREAVGRHGLPDGGFARALDLGCGTGLVAEAFRDIVHAIDGVDLAPKMLARARERNVYQGLFHGGVAETTRARARAGVAYDLVLAADLFIYIGDLEDVYAATAEAMETGGLFVFSVEGLEEGDYVLRPTGRYAQSRGYIQRLAAGHGFTVVHEGAVDIRRKTDGMVTGDLFILRKADGPPA